MIRTLALLNRVVEDRIIPVTIGYCGKLMGVMLDFCFEGTNK